MNHKGLIYLIGLLFFFPFQSQAQDRLKKMPGYEQYKQVAPQIYSSVKMGRLSVEWSEDGKSFEYAKDGRQWSYDVKKKKATDIGKAKRRQGRRRWNGPARGRQYSSADSPDGSLKAYTHERNMYISKPDGSESYAITTDGNMDNQLKYGIATWVYGEELGQNTAMWWSPDGKKIAFYRFNEKGSKKYYVLYHQTKIQDSVEIEAYPKVGAQNL
ncbi:MAG: DPP IV N-terminal domain-containing protein, partial [Bacteroidota bacterium]